MIRCTLAVAIALASAGATTAQAQAVNFGRMFPGLPAFTAPTAQQLADLAQTQLDPGGPALDSVLPAIRTYEGQFIDHDLTLDQTPPPTRPVDPTTIPNGRSFVFDLDSVFGSGPAGSPQLYAGDHRHLLISESNVNGVRDLPRRPDGSAILVEGRNDENEIVSQLHVAFAEFYNRLIDQGASVASAQRTTTDYYQWEVIKGFLPDLVGQGVVDQALRCPGQAPVLTACKISTPLLASAAATPIEFSVAAYRSGHSLVRFSYTINDDANGVARKFTLFTDGTSDLSGGRPLPGDRQIEWKYFVPELNEQGSADPDFNFTRQIDPLLASGLFNLPIPGAEATGSNVLAFRNMTRGQAYGLPSYEDVARAMGISPVDTGIHRLAEFATGTPLWYGILAESAQREAGQRLGPVGAQIVAQTFIRVLADDPNSILHHGFIPRPPIAQAKGDFDIGDLLVFAGVANRP
jgi:hypothetical protein